MSLEIDLYGDWYCEPHQDRIWRYFEAGGKRGVWIVHRRGGKDEVGLRRASTSMLERVGNYWHMLPQAEQARKAIWEALNPHTGRRRIDEAFPVELRHRTRSNEMMIEYKNGSIWQVVGSDNYNALVGSPPIGVVFSEYSLADPSAWAYIRPILRENGGWALFIYTPRGRNHGLTLYESAKRSKGWFHEILSAHDTDVFTTAELEEELRELQEQYGPELGRAFFEQEYLCSFDAANIGAIYASAIRNVDQRGGICPLPHDPDFGVHTAWDFGFGDSTAIWWFQILPGPRLHVIDHYRNAGQDIKHYVERVKGRFISETPDGKICLGDSVPGHEHRQAYRYESHNVPHDGANHTLAAGGRSIGDQAYAMGVDMNVIPSTSQSDSIAAARRTIEYCSFDMTRCADGLEALRSYHFPWDDKLKRLGDAPVHDWSSHDADAFEIVGQVWQPNRSDVPKPKPRFLHEATADEVFWPEHSGVSKWKRERV
jgi:phage terminase large subunit